MKALQKVGSVRPSGLLRPYEWPAPTPAQTLKHGSLIASGRSALGQPGKVGAGFLVAGGMAALSASLTTHWTGNDGAILTVIGCLCLAGGSALFCIGDRMPHWALHIAGVADIAAVTVGAAIGPSGHVDFAVLYIWIVVWAALFFGPLVTLTYAVTVGITYALLLGIGPAVDNPVAAWLATIGTGAFAGAVVLGLVSVLRSDARVDALTGLPNRRSWDERLDGELERTRRAGTALSVAMIDLDNFKRVNDLRGHDAGDVLLKELSVAWQGVVRGGGDFGLLAPSCDATGIQRLGERLAETTPDGIAYSIGTVTWDGNETAGDLLRRADQSMYRDKLLHRHHR